jgi:hypothetical protein
MNNDDVVKLVVAHTHEIPLSTQRTARAGISKNL